MEDDAALPQGLVEFWGQKQEQERCAEGEGIVQQPQAGAYGDDGNRQGRDELQSKGTGESQLEYLQGGLRKALAERSEILTLCLFLGEKLPGHHAAQHVVEAGIELLETMPFPAAGGFGGLAYQIEQEGGNRQGKGEEQGGQRIGCKGSGEDDRCAEQECTGHWQCLAEQVVEPIDGFGSLQ